MYVSGTEAMVIGQLYMSIEADGAKERYIGKWGVKNPAKIEKGRERCYKVLIQVEVTCHK